MLLHQPGIYSCHNVLSGRFVFYERFDFLTVYTYKYTGQLCKDTSLASVGRCRNAPCVLQMCIAGRYTPVQAVHAESKGTRRDRSAYLRL